MNTLFCDAGNLTPIKGDNRPYVIADIKSRLEKRAKEISRWKQLLPFEAYLPASPEREIWNMVLLVLCLYVAAAVPIQVFFQTEDYILFFKFNSGFVWLIEKTIDAVFIVDIFLNLRTAFYNDVGHLVTDWKSIVAHYCYYKPWFWGDLLSVMPYELIPTANMFKMLRLVKLLRLLRLRSIFEGTVETGIPLVDHPIAFVIMYRKPLSLLGGTLYLAHLLACFWFYIGITSPVPSSSEASAQLDSTPCVEGGPCWHANADYERGSEGWISVAIGNGHLPGDEPNLWTKYVSTRAIPATI